MQKTRTRILKCVPALLLMATVLWPAMPAAAQSDPNNYDAGKTPPQMFASNCGICHKSPVGLAKGLGGIGLKLFLRDHYSASAQAAGMIASYLRTIDAAQAPSPPSAKRRKGEGQAKGSDTSRKSSDKATPAGTRANAKGGTETKVDMKSGDKVAAPKPSDTKASEPKGSDAKPPDNKPPDNKPSDASAAKPADKSN